MDKSRGFQLRLSLLTAPLLRKRHGILEMSITNRSYGKPLRLFAILKVSVVK